MLFTVWSPDPSIPQKKTCSACEWSPCSLNCYLMTQCHCEAKGLKGQPSISYLNFLLILDLPNEITSASCESKEQQPETVCQSHATREQTSDQSEKNEIATHTTLRPAADSKVSASKTQKGTGRKLSAKKLSTSDASVNVHTKRHLDTKLNLLALMMPLISGKRIKCPRTEK